MIRIGKLPNKYAEASVLGAVSGGLTTTLLSKVLAQNPLPFVIPDWDQQLVGWLALRLNSIDSVFFPGIAARYQYYLDTIGFPAWQITGRYDLAAIAGLGIAGLVTWLIGRPLPDTKIVSGRYLYEGKEAIKRLKKITEDEIKLSGEGVRIHPDLIISRDRATRGVFFWGSVGGGKTQAILPMINDARKGGHRVLIHDIKGDFTASLEGPFALIAPCDARSMAWDVAKDVLNDQAAYEFAAQIIVKTDDPIWSDGSRQILRAVIKDLQAEMGREWTWSDLYKKCISSQDELIKIVRRQVPEIDIVIQSESKTTDGILMNYIVALKVISDMATAWKTVKPENRISISNWLHTENSNFRTIVLQNNSEYQELSYGLLKAFTTMLSSMINSPKFSDSRTRKVFLFFDEVPGMGKLNLSPILTRARSKGVITVLAAQDKNQLDEIYGVPTSNTWSSCVGTQILFRTNASETTKNYLSEVLFGFSTIERYWWKDGQLQWSGREDQRILEPSDISDYLRVDTKGALGGVVGFGDAYLLRWPVRPTIEVRNPFVPAQWMYEIDQHIEYQKSAFDKMNNKSQQKQILLRPPTRQEIQEMADSGSDITDAVDPIDEMVPDLPTGDDK